MSSKLISNKRISKLIESTFQKEGIDFQKEVDAGGTIADYYINTPKTGSVIFEVKGWEPTKINLERAKVISESIIKAANVNQAYVVLPYIGPRGRSQGAITINQISNIISGSEMNGVEVVKYPEIRKFNPNKSIFVAMPFRPIYEDTYKVAIEPACSFLNSRCVRVDYLNYSGDIKEQIMKEIKASKLIIADISDSNPNVMFEIGYAKGKNKPCIQISSSSSSDIPFDINHDKTLFYEIGRTYLLKDKLIESLNELLNSK